MLNTHETITSLTDVGICLRTIIKSRYKKNIKIIYTKGRYKSLYISFYKSPYVYQFYVEDRSGQYRVYLLKDNRIVKKDAIRNNESIDNFYKKIRYFF